eukprot:TRINITY_DN11639_c0_g1_i1.p1 TRINITY_DN11639_c0_g1~~TRINITY_DN11639_c0_g1_i1.p1  ORF type:complete len:509 (+),score=43.49 TRINITY_DN11639_c0_g1_i1:283-1809(+)
MWSGSRYRLLSRVVTTGYNLRDIARTPQTQGCHGCQARQYHGRGTLDLSFNSANVQSKKTAKPSALSVTLIFVRGPFRDSVEIQNSMCSHSMAQTLTSYTHLAWGSKVNDKCFPAIHSAGSSSTVVRIPTCDISSRHYVCDVACGGCVVYSAQNTVMAGHSFLTRRPQNSDCYKVDIQARPLHMVVSGCNLRKDADFDFTKPPPKGRCFHKTTGFLQGLLKEERKMCGSLSLQITVFGSLSKPHTRSFCRIPCSVENGPSRYSLQEEQRRQASVLAIEGDGAMEGERQKQEVEEEEGKEVEGEMAGEEVDFDRDEGTSLTKGGEPRGGGVLYLVGTPIGNLEDISFRAIRILKEADLVLAEDTRHSGRLLHHYGIKTPMLSYHQFNASARRSPLLKRLLERCEALALISDAGMPGISDPGADLVAACAEAGVPVVPIPGPSAVVCSVAAAGFLNAEFTFLGFLPDKASSRRRRLAASASDRPSQVMYAAPHKLRALLDDCVAAFGAGR